MAKRLNSTFGKIKKRNKNRPFLRKGSVEVLILLVVVAFALLVGGVLKPATPPGTGLAPNACIDYNPPSTADTVIFNATQYDLIKKGAAIIDSKVPEMTKVGNFSGDDLYQMNSSNYFGQKGFSDVIYRLKGVKIGYHYFDIYLKDGVPIPSSITNSKQIGGTLTVVEGDTTTFPPYGFNTNQVTGATTTLPAPAYISSGAKVSSASVTQLVGVQQVGQLATIRGQKMLFTHLGTVYLIDGVDAYEYLPSDKALPVLANEHHAEQLKKVDFVVVPAVCWYTPECKPAIYIQTDTQKDVNVRVSPKGYFTQTIPNYPSNGWQITAFPNGDLHSNGKTYPYLYYESMINDWAFTKPTSGYVVAYNGLSNLYDSLLPKLGLVNKEISQFKSYWQKALPTSAYYFVGIMPQSDINTIEPLSVSPVPDKIIRVRLYFEALKDKISVPQPEITVVKRPTHGFVVAEWGGMVKTDATSHFTCSQ